MAIVPQSDQQDRITRELAALAALRAHRSNSDLPAQLAAESYQQHDRLRELAEQQRAAELQAADIAAGLRAWRGRVPNGSTRGQARRVARRGWRAARVIPLADAIPQI